MIVRAPTIDLHPDWLDGQRGDIFEVHPALGYAHLCLRDDDLTTWVFTGDLPGTIEAAREMVAYA